MDLKGTPFWCMWFKPFLLPRPAAASGPDSFVYHFTDPGTGRASPGGYMHTESRNLV